MQKVIHCWTWHGQQGSQLVVLETSERGVRRCFVREDREGVTLCKCEFLERDLRNAEGREDAMGKLEDLLRQAAEQAGTSRTPSKAPDDAKAAKKWPMVYACLTQTTLEDGSSREASKVTLFFEHGTWKGGITEPNLECSAWATASTLEGVLDALEARLTSGDPDVWKKWNWTGKKSSGKSRK